MHRKSMTGALFALISAAIASASCGSSDSKSSSGGADGGDGGGPGLFSDASSDGGGSEGGVSQPVSIDNCPGALTGATVTALQAGGPVDAQMKWLYPYDATVFAGGLLPPVLQWSPQSGGVDAIYVHLRSKMFEYKGCFGPANPARLPLDATAWAAAFAKSSGATDPVTVELTTMAQSKVSGPIKETWTLALGTLKGAVYYNTYTSPQVQNNGAVMRIAAGSPTPTAFLSVSGSSPQGPCISCHSLSADGSMIVAQRHQYPGGLVQSESYDLKQTPTPNPAAPLGTSTSDDWGFSALYPDGSRLLTDGSPGQTGGLFPAGPGNNPGMIGPKASVMYDPRTGATIAMSGLVTYAQMPMFSPDGAKLVFNDFDAGSGHQLSVMDFNAGTNAFANKQSVFTDASRFPGWPFFTPDAKSVVFALGDSPNYASVKNPPLPGTGVSDLSIVDVATHALHALDAANGYNGSASYLPYPGRDEHLNFYPTVSPVAAGGYFWVFFTSRRNYGNTIVGSVDDAKSKKIWVSAVSIDAPPGGDASHPAFYLPGQEEASGNIRAFATLEPCKGDGQGCTSGIDCCGGFCTGGVCGGATGCAHVDEKCAKDGDCCDSAMRCIGGFCASVIK